MVGLNGRKAIRTGVFARRKCRAGFSKSPEPEENLLREEWEIQQGEGRILGKRSQVSGNLDGKSERSKDPRKQSPPAGTNPSRCKQGDGFSAGINPLERR